MEWVISVLIALGFLLVMMSGTIIEGIRESKWWPRISSRIKKWCNDHEKAIDRTFLVIIVLIAAATFALGVVLIHDIIFTPVAFI